MTEDVKSTEFFLNGSNKVEKEGAENNVVSFRQALRDIFALAIPGVISLVIACIGRLGSIYALGQLDPKYTGGMGLGTTMSGFLALSPLVSFASGLDTLIPQSFGKKDYKMCGIYNNRGIVMLTVLGVPLNLILFFSYYILRLFGYESSLAVLAAWYSIASIPHTFLHVGCVVYNSFMAGQRIVAPTMIVDCIMSGLQPLFSYMFTIWLDLGYLGVAYAYNLTSLLGFGITIVYVCNSSIFKKTIAPWTKEVFRGWGSFFSVCGYSALLSCLGSWAYHIMLFFASKLSKEELAAHVALLNILLILYIFPMGIGIAANTLVGNKLGERNVTQAIFYAKVCIGANLVLSFILELLVLLFKDLVGTFYSTDEKVNYFIIDTIPIVVMASVFDTIQGVFYKIIYALGKQKYASMVTLISHWAVRVPIAILITFTFSLRLRGLWMTFIFSFAFAAIGFGCIVIRTDWAATAREIYERIEKDRRTIESQINS